MGSRSPSCQGCEFLESFLLLLFKHAVIVDVFCHGLCLLPLPGEDQFLVGITPTGKWSTAQTTHLYLIISSAFLLVIHELVFFPFLAFAEEFHVNFHSSVFKYFVESWTLKMSKIFCCRKMTTERVCTDWTIVYYWKGSLTFSLRCQFPFGLGIANVILRVPVVPSKTYCPSISRIQAF